MNEISDNFKERLKKKKEGLDIGSNPLSLLESISDEMESEIESNTSLKFKRSLSESRKKLDIKSQPNLSGLFSNLSEIKEEEKIVEHKKEELIDFFSSLSERQEPLEQEFTEILQENRWDLYETEEDFIAEEPKPEENIIEEVLVQVEKEEPKPDLIAAAVQSISKEEALKPQDNIPEDYTNLFGNPETTKTDPNIKSLQNKMKFLEEWISKISMTGPGGGSGSILDLDTPVISVNGDYTMNRKDYCLLVNPSVKTYINLPPAYNERKVIVKDISGHAQLTPIHINGTIDGDPNGAEIRVNYASLQLIYFNNSWWII